MLMLFKTSNLRCTIYFCVKSFRGQMLGYRSINGKAVMTTSKDLAIFNIDTVIC